MSADEEHLMCVMGRPLSWFKEAKKVMIIGDTHCGHWTGLAAPQYHLKPGDDPDLERCRRVQEALWNFYEGTLKIFGSVDECIINGDCVQGDDERNRGVELIQGDRVKQADIATTCFKRVKATKFSVIGGTLAHAGDAEDYDKLVAEKLNAAGYPCTFHNVDYLPKYYDVCFNVRHELRCGRQPTVQAAALRRILIDELVDVHKGYQDEPSDVLVRSHIHLYSDVAGFRIGSRCFTLPALQMRGSKIGRKYSGSYDVGMVLFYIGPNGKEDWTWTYRQFTLSQPRKHVKQ